jgi:hypothetical protein
MGDSHEPDGYNSFAAIYGRNQDVNLIGFGAFNGCEVQFDSSRPFSKVEACAGRLATLNDPSSPRRSVGSCSARTARSTRVRS